VTTAADWGPVLMAAPPAPELHHLTCCDDDTAMCGADVTGQEWCEEDREPRCEPCYRVNEQRLPCTVPGCPAGKEAPK